MESADIDLFPCSLLYPTMYPLGVLTPHCEIFSRSRSLLLCTRKTKVGVWDLWKPPFFNLCSAKESMESCFPPCAYEE